MLITDLGMALMTTLHQQKVVEDSDNDNSWQLRKALVQYWSLLL